MASTKTDKTQIIQMVLQAVNTLADSVMSTYVSVHVARLKAEVFSRAYCAHVAQGKLPEEAMSLGMGVAEVMAKSVEAKS